MLSSEGCSVSLMLVDLVPSDQTTHSAAVEEIFKSQYSTDQRYVILNALALGARELACLPLPETAAAQPLTGHRVYFPSK
jgi:hypothetical protein